MGGPVAGGLMLSHVGLKRLQALRRAGRELTTLETALAQLADQEATARGVQFRRGMNALDELDPERLRCRAFFRPWPTLRVMANGEVGICPLMLGGEGFGNVHGRPLVEILNGLHEAPLYRLHASGEIGRYLERVDRSVFGERFDHVCAVRVAANRLALADASAASHATAPVRGAHRPLG